MKKVCMIVQQKDVKGGIAAVVGGYYGSDLERDYELTYIESYRDGSKWDKLMKALKAYREFSSLLKKNPPDLVHIHSSFGPSFYRKIPFISMASKKGIPVINHIHGAEFDAFYSDAPESKKKRIRKVYGKCSRFIVLSEEWKAHIGLIVPEEKITIIENYGIPQKKEDVEKWQKTRNEHPQVLFLGEIGKRKGAFDLPDIISGVLEKKKDVRFVIGGSGEISALKEALRARNIPEEAVLFPGWVTGEKKDALLKESSLLLLPSYNEGMPMSVLDAMSYALSVVSTKVGGTPKLVKDGENGFLFTPGDTKGMSEAILALLDDTEKQNAAGLLSLAIVEGEYSLKQHIEKLEKVYEESLVVS